MIPSGVKVFLASHPVDFRKGIHGLVALVRDAGSDPFDRALANGWPSSEIDALMPWNAAALRPHLAAYFRSVRIEGRGMCGRKPSPTTDEQLTARQRWLDRLAMRYKSPPMNEPDESDL